jgi:hypothetical protein
MSPAGLTDSGGSSTGRVHAGTRIRPRIAGAVHTVHTPNDLEYLNINLDIGEVNARQAP